MLEILYQDKYIIAIIIKTIPAITTKGCNKANINKIIPNISNIRKNNYTYSGS